ncbi:hypothetical protein JYT29_03310 [Nitrospina gracilis]|nr:hypothetical protein [Nitrospina gracilis]
MSETTNASKIIDALKSEANETLASVLGSTPLEAFNITDLGNFPYVWQNPSNLKFNKKTYTWIKSNLRADTTPLQFDPGTDFVNQYLQQATNIRWSLSEADQATLNKAAANATQQQAAVLNAWKSAMGSLPDPDGGLPIDSIANIITTTWADPPTDLNTIKTSLNLGKLLNKTPASGAPVLPVFVSWLNALGSSLALQNNVTMNNGYLDRAIDAIQNPTTENGGLAVDDGKIYPAYQVANQVSEIENALKAGSPVTLDMKVSRSTTDEFEVTITGQTGFKIPILEYFDVGVGASADYFSSDIATTDNTTTVSMSFPGVNLVNYGPVAFTQAGTSESWYWMDPIRAAVENGFPAADVSDYKFATEPTISDFDDTGQFGYVVGVAIAGYPTVTITVESASYQKIQKTFEQTVSSSVSFLGIKLASASESTYSNKVEVDESKSTVTITLSPPPSLVAGNVVDSVGWVLGVQPMYPAAS